MSAAVDSPNEAMYRRIKDRRCGPPILITLSDGQKWNTMELSKRYGQHSVMHKRDATYSVLCYYTRRGFVRHAGHVLLRRGRQGHRVSLWQITPEGMAIVRGAK